MEEMDKENAGMAQDKPQTLNPKPKTLNPNPKP